MIYLVTKNIQLFENPLYKVISVKESIEILNKLNIIGVDTETTGIDVFTNTLLLVQLGCKEFQVVIDCKTVNIKEYKDLLENSSKLFLFWNAKFDLKWFLKEEIIINNIYDGYLAERLLWLGYPTGYHSLSLKTAGETYCNIELDKSVRGKIIWSKTLTDDIILYSANDVKYLEDIYNKQLIKLKKQGLSTAIKYENAFCPVLAYTEFCGVKLDVEKWKEKMKKDNQAKEESVKLLNDWVSKNLPNSKYVFVDRQGDLFTGFNLTPQCIINWSSPKQVIPLFEELGFKLDTFDKKTKEKKKSVEADIIEKQKDLSDIAPLYLKYKESEKLVGTYGQNVLDQINPVTNRIHTNYNQLGTDTGKIITKVLKFNLYYLSLYR